MHRFKKEKRKVQQQADTWGGMSGRGGKNENTCTGTHNEETSVSNSSKTGLWRRKSLLDVYSKCTIIWAGWQDFQFDSIQLTSQLSFFSKIRYKKYWLHTNVVSPSMVQYILLQLLLQVCTSGFPVQWLRSSFPHEQIWFDLAALQFEEGNEKYIFILFLGENNKRNVISV